MRALEPPEKPEWVLSFDFDGTLHDPSHPVPILPEFFDWIRKLRVKRSAVWGINTGRTMEHVIEGLIESRFPFLPDWVVAREREVWRPNHVGRWIADRHWNRACEREQRRFFKRVRKVLVRIRHEVEEQTGATWVEQKGDPAGLIARTVEEMEWIVARVRIHSAEEPLLGWQRNSIYLRFGHRDYQKGSSLRHVAAGFELGPDRCFAIGDSHNDFEMLSPEAAGHIACPANAAPDIVEHVRSVVGYVCREEHSAGCVEAMAHFFRL